MSRIFYEESEVIDLNVVQEIVMPVSAAHMHMFCGVVYCSDKEGKSFVPATSLSGQASISIVTLNQPQGYQSISFPILLANKLMQAGWSSNTRTVRVLFSDVQGASHAKLIITGNSA